MWATQNVRILSIAERTTSMKKVMYAIVFNSRDEMVHVPTSRSKTVTGKLYRRLAMKKFENYVKKRRPKLCLKSLTLLQDNVLAHTSKNTQVLENPPAPTLSTRFSPMLLFLASTSNKTLEGWRYNSRQVVGAAMFQFLKGVPTKHYAEAFHK